MKIKRFIAPDMRQAIRLVRGEQGPDAVILSTRNVPAGIEIVSAVDFDQALISDMADALPPQTEDRRGDNRVRESGGEMAAPVPRSGPPAGHADERPADPGFEAPEREAGAQDRVLSQMQQELSAMKGLLRDQFDRLAWDDFARREPLKAAHLKRLRSLGIGDPLAEGIVKSVREAGDAQRAWREVLLSLARKIRVQKEDEPVPGSVIALIGPTGVGKTTTLAKLAARYALRHAASEIAMVTLDTFRIGAYRQLKTYGQILGVPVIESSAERLESVLTGLEGKRLVLIDTSGMGHRDRRLQRQLADLSRLSSVRSYLTVAANSQREVIHAVMDAFSIASPVGCVLTKLDEALTLGEPLTELILRRMPLAYCTAGQRVPEDLSPARVSDLVSRMIALERAQVMEDGVVSGSPRTPRPPVPEGAANAHV